MKTKNSLIELFQVLNTAFTKGTAKFKYGVKKNLIFINPEIESFKAIENDNSEIIKEFSIAKNAVYQKYGKPIENNLLLIEEFNEDGTVKETYTKAMKEMVDLMKLHKGPLEKFAEKLKEYKTFLSEESAVLEVWEIKLEDCPDTLTDKEMGLLMDFEIVK